MGVEIEGYEFGRILVGGKTFRTDLILLPGRIVPDWWRNEGHALAVSDLWEVEQAESKPEVLVVGTGSSGRMIILPETRRWLEEMGIALEEYPTAEACRRYNTLLREGRRVAAALHLTC